MRIEDLSKKIITGALLASFAFFPVNLFEKKRENWFPFYIPWNYCQDSRLDFSFLLDAPAGSHGFLTVKDGHFYFEDGKKARFWGVNIHSDTACFPTRKQAEDVSKRLAQLGCNAVRMHFLDNEAPHGIIASHRNDSQHLSESQMDKLDYFIYQLKQNGIYVCFDVLGLGVRRFKKDDMVPELKDMPRGARGISFFNKRIIELSKKFAFDFLSHVNPYTGVSYLDEPAIAFVEMTNENSIFFKSCRNFSPYYENEIEGLWKKWLVDNDKNLDGDWAHWSEDREFLYELTDGYQRDMYEYLRSIGVKVPIGASNIPYDSLMLLADSHMDFTDIHVYWDLCDSMDKIHNRPLVKQDHTNPKTIVNTISIAKTSKKPLMSTEWGSNWPNEWRSIDMLTTASYASLNDWDALFLYSYNGGYTSNWYDLEKRLYFGTVVFNDPAKMGLFSLAALMFLRDDIEKSSKVYTVRYPVESLFKMDDTWADRLGMAGAAYLARVEKIFYRNNEGGPGTEVDYPDLEGLSNEDGTVVSDTGQITRDHKKGVFMLKTPRVFSFSGFLSEKQDQEFQGVRFSTEEDFATFTVISMDDKDISGSKRLLLAVVGRVQNRGQKLAPHITKSSDDLRRDVYILNEGEEPIMVEDIEGNIFIEKTENDNGLMVFSLDEKGHRKETVPVKRVRDGYSFDVSGSYQTIYYEIIRM
ncbi:MAG: hypothetical protein P9L93_05830 [Candidatus Gorgyraea atricola]|nr:hypothetical protein [Candidatus Gorgyraea atricola]